MKGTSENTFTPEGKLTRAMAATIVYRFSEAEESETKSPFKDVPGDSYYATAVSWASKNGIINGTSTDTFNPDANITREDFISILYRYDEKFNDSSGTKNETPPNFPDKDQVSDYALDAMSWSFKNKIINGDSYGMITPKNEITRAETAAVLFNYDDINHDKLFDINIDNVEKIVLHNGKQYDVFPGEHVDITKEIIDYLNSFEYNQKLALHIIDGHNQSITIYEKGKGLTHDYLIYSNSVRDSGISYISDNDHFPEDWIVKLINKIK